MRRAAQRRRGRRSMRLFQQRGRHLICSWARVLPTQHGKSGIFDGPAPEGEGRCVCKRRRRRRTSAVRVRQAGGWMMQLEKVPATGSRVSVCTVLFPRSMPCPPTDPPPRSFAASQSARSPGILVCLCLSLGCWKVLCWLLPGSQPRPEAGQAAGARSRPVSGLCAVSQLLSILYLYFCVCTAVQYVL